MRGRTFSFGTMRGTAALALLALALFMRVLVPTGWMPMAGNGYAITLCTGMGAVTGWVDDQGKLHKGKADDSRPEHPCAFSGFSAAADLPAAAPLIRQPGLIASADILLRLIAADIGHGLAAPPPPPTGPPSIA